MCLVIEVMTLVRICSTLHQANWSTMLLGAGILCDPLTNHQSFYLNHNDDIVCMALNPRSTKVIATGQIGKNAPVHIWDLQSRETLSIVQGAHSVGVCSVDFSHNGKLLLCVGLDSKHSITVWRWTESE